MNTQGLHHLPAAIGKLSPLGKVIAAALAIILCVVLCAVGGMVTYRVAKARYDRREAARMKQVQVLTADAEAAEKRAEAKEAQAELLQQQNTAKARDATAQKAKLEQEAQTREAQINREFADDVRRINSAQSDCDRCRDSCARLERAAGRNPNLAEFRCAADACTDACATADTVH